MKKVIKYLLSISLLLSVKAYSAEEENLNQAALKEQDEKNKKQLTFVLKKRENINPLLMAAIKNNNQAILQSLLDAKADPNLNHESTTEFDVDLTSFFDCLKDNAK